MSTSTVPGYFNEVLPANWDYKNFLDTKNSAYVWFDSLRTIELASETYGDIAAARATSILNQDAYDNYFRRFPPTEWDASHFETITSRSSAWQWALFQVLADPSLNEVEAKKEALRCLNAKTPAPVFFPFPTPPSPLPPSTLYTIVTRFAVSLPR
jgi:hypothetical protein